jgi:hypothetical protein
MTVWGRYPDEWEEKRQEQSEWDEVHRAKAREARSKEIVEQFEPFHI